MQKQANHKMGIYTITNILDNKIYVGYALDFDDRWRVHKCDLRHNRHKNTHLQGAWNKYGEDTFLFEELEESEEQFLCGQEHYWCLMLNTHNDKFGYNISPTDPSKKSVRKSEQERKNMSLAHIGKPSPKLGHRASSETLLKMSLANIGKKHIGVIKPCYSQVDIFDINHLFIETIFYKEALIKYGSSIHYHIKQKSLYNGFYIQRTPNTKRKTKK